MLTTPSHWIVSLSLQGGSDTGIQNACHHPLEEKSVTRDSLVTRRRMHHTHYTKKKKPSSRAHTLYEALCTRGSDEQKARTLSAIMCDVEMKIQILGINISTGLWIASKTCAALLRTSCLQFEVCHGWFSLTGGILSTGKKMRDTVDVSSVFVFYIPVWVNKCTTTLLMYWFKSTDGENIWGKVWYSLKTFSQQRTTLQSASLFTLSMLNALEITALFPI